MLPEQYRWIAVQFEPEGDAHALAEIAEILLADGNLEGAATVYDRAFGLEPRADDIRLARARVLDQLAVVEHGLTFRYIPGGVFLMGSDQGEADEQPWHPVWLSPYWLSETPLSWAAYCRLMNWEAPPVGQPRDYRWDYQAPPVPDDDATSYLGGAIKIRLQYCEAHTLQARGDWHSHAPGQTWTSGGGRVQTSQERFGTPLRDDPEASMEYDSKPLVSISWGQAMTFAKRLGGDRIRYTLPTEAQWEKAARGGLIGCRYPWGERGPSHENCDCDRFHEFSIRPMRTFPPNGYRLFAMCGGVWEWTRDWYDRDYYRAAPDTDPPGPQQGQEKVLRGGSWADCAEAATVTYRMSRPSNYSLAPNIGFRLCREALAQ